MENIKNVNDKKVKKLYENMKYKKIKCMITQACGKLFV